MSNSNQALPGGDLGVQHQEHDPEVRELAAMIAERARLDEKISALAEKIQNDAVASIRKMMAEHGITTADLGGRASSAAKMPGQGPSKVKAKYLEPVSGKTWTGRGMKPVWMREAIASGKSASDFLIA